MFSGARKCSSLLKDSSEYKQPLTDFFEKKKVLNDWCTMYTFCFTLVLLFILVVYTNAREDNEKQFYFSHYGELHSNSFLAGFCQELTL